MNNKKENYDNFRIQYQSGRNEIQPSKVRNESDLRSRYRPGPCSGYISQGNYLQGQIRRLYKSESLGVYNYEKHIY